MLSGNLFTKSDEGSQHFGPRFAARLLLAALLLASLTSLTYAQASPPQQRKSPWVESTDTRPAEVAYKNIKVFTGLPANRLEQVMKTWKDSLGVECTFCHVRNEWHEDTKEEKGFGREMHKLTTNLAKDYFAGEQSVTCYTCHRGEKVPAKRLPAAPVQRRPRPVQP